MMKFDKIYQLDQGLQAFSLEGQTITIPCPVGHLVSVTSIQLCSREQR